MPKDKKRYKYLDFLKFIGMYMVCFYHFNTLDFNFLHGSLKNYFYYFVKGIFSVCVALFFMVNGALMLNRELNLKKHIKKILRLIIFTYIWGSIQLLVYMFIKGDVYTIGSFINSLLDWKQGRINSLWFLHALTCIYILFPLIKCVYDNKDKHIIKYVLVSVFLLTFGIVFLNMGINVLQFLKSSTGIQRTFFDIFIDKFNPYKGFQAYALVYFIIGGILFNKLENKEINISTLKINIFYSISLILLFLYGLIMSFSNKEIYDIVWNGYDTIMTLIMCIGIFIVAFRMEGKLYRFEKIIQLIGENTLGIYLIHGLVGHALRPLYLSLNAGLIINILLILLLMFICLGIVLILKKIPIVKELFKLG